MQQVVLFLTASHNPKQWNALKLLNNKGEFISSEDGQQILSIAENDDYSFSEIDQIGNYTYNDSHNQKHIDDVLNLDLVNVDLIKSKKFRVVLDAVNSTGGMLIPQLLEKLELNVLNYIVIQMEIFLTILNHFQKI